ncbi:MAG: hypothetical protein ACXACG_12795 [Candidatus Thorarchaeota archaeon]|jgi:hypothetical protein
MAAFCVMVKGPCRGKMCDFWAGVRLRKLHIDELVQDLRINISSCEEDTSSSLDDAFSRYWTNFGFKDLRRFCEEDPELCSKMKQAEERVRKIIL